MSEGRGRRCRVGGSSVEVDAEVVLCAELILGRISIDIVVVVVVDKISSF